MVTANNLQIAGGVFKDLVAKVLKVLYHRKIMQSFRNFKLMLISLMALLLAGCVSTELVKDYRTITGSLPQIKTAEISTASGVKKGPDYKERSTATDRVRLVLVRGEENDSIPPSVRALTEQRLLYLLSTLKVEVAEAPESLQSDDESLSEESMQFLKEKRIDAILRITFSKEENKARPVLLASLLDPYDLSAMGRLDILLEEEGGRSASDRQIDFYKSSEGYHFLKPLAFPRYSMSNLNRDRLSAFVHRSVSARVTILSTTPETRIRMKSANGGNRVLGTTPVDLVLDEGDYTVEADRRGAVSQVRTFRVRAGKDQSMMFSWGDDPDQTSLAIHSAPSGLRVSLEKDILGYTPVYRADYPAGIYRLELARMDKDEKSGDVLMRGDLGISMGRHNDLVFFSQYETEGNSDPLKDGYWLLAAEAGVRPVVKWDQSGLFMTAGKTESDSRFGILSREIPLRDMEVELKIPGNKKDLVLVGLITEADSVLLEGSEGGFQPIIFRRGVLDKSSKAYRPRPGMEKFDRRVTIIYTASKRELRVKLDGDELIRTRLDAVDLGRIAILTSGVQGSAPMIKNIQITME